MAPITAPGILSTYWKWGEIPVDPMRIASLMGLELLALPKFEVLGQYEPKGPNGLPRITYKSSEPFLRQRFIVAHALGHHVMGRKERVQDTSEHYTMDYPDGREVAANKFAMQLLIPKNAVNAAIAIKEVDNVADLARMFVVSPVAMSHRLREIGYNVP